MVMDAFVGVAVGKGVAVRVAVGGTDVAVTGIGRAQSHWGRIANVVVGRCGNDGPRCGNREIHSA